VNRMSQSLVLLLLGGAVLRVTVLSTTYVNYVKPGFRPFLIAAGAVVFALGVIGLIQEWRKPYLAETDAHDSGNSAHDEAHDGHDHSHGPRVAWLLCLPVFAIFLIAPPALGAFAARSEEAPVRPRSLALDAFVPLPDGAVTDMTLGEFIGRAWGDSNRSLAGKKVRLTGFVVGSAKKDRWYVTRMQIACCAADGIPLKVAVLGAPRPPEDTWVEVTGTWVDPKTNKIPNGTVAPELTATDVTEIPKPAEPYEG
jgi:uncharacterized repeat protein (TIGR03943 family)